MVRIASYPQHARQRPDPIRIAGIAGAIAANVALFAFLVMPQSYTLPAEPTEPRVPAIIIPDVPPKLVDPPIIPVVKQQPPQRPTLTKLRDETPKPPPVITNLPGPVDFHVPPPQPPIPPTDGGDTPRPPATISTSLNPIAAPPPSYPIDAVRDEVTGTVQLELLVGIDGRVIDARVVRSSGDRRLDAAARDQVLHNWRFAPVLQNGIPVQARGDLPVVFTLNGQ